MKYFSRVVIALLIAAVIVFAFSNHYRSKKNQENIVLTTHKISDITNAADTRILLAEEKESGYTLYRDNGTIILCRGELEQSFDEWYSAMASSTPELYYNDFDEDGEKELVIIMLNDLVKYYDGKSEYSTSAVFVKTETDEQGNTSFKTITAGVDSWKAPFTNSIKCEMKQLTKCKKYIQFVMGNAGATFRYDEETGISLDGNCYYAKAIKLGDGNYAEFDRWQKGACKYYVSDEGELRLSITVLTYYNEQPKPQIMGSIDMKMRLLQKGKFDITPNTITFIPSSYCYASDPRITASESWTNIIKNSASPASSQDKEIDWIEADFKINSQYNEQTISFADMTSQIKSVDKVKISESKIVLYAKEGYSFSKRPLSTGSFSATINSGEENEYDLSYTCEVKSVSGTSVLVIDFDKTYDKSDIESIKIKYGA